MVIDGLRGNLKMECVDLCFFYMAFTVFSMGFLVGHFQVFVGVNILFDRNADQYLHSTEESQIPLSEVALTHRCHPAVLFLNRLIAIPSPALFATFLPPLLTFFARSPWLWHKVASIAC